VTKRRTLARQLAQAPNCDSSQAAGFAGRFFFALRLFA
jgi:hypothetical protein